MATAVMMAPHAHTMGHASKGGPRKGKHPKGIGGNAAVATFSAPVQVMQRGVVDVNALESMLLAPTPVNNMTLALDDVASR